MGEVIPMDSLSRNAREPGQDAPGGSGGKFGDFMDKARSSMPDMPEKHQKALQRTLGQLQKAAPTINKMASKGMLGKIGLIKSVVEKVEWGKDWIFILVASFALLKDIFDFALAGVPGVGVIVSWIMAIMLLMLTIVALLLTGSNLKNRGQAKYILSILGGTIIEALPVLSWLPMAFTETILVYGLVLFDRMELSPDQENEGGEAQPQTEEPERKAA